MYSRMIKFMLNEATLNNFISVTFKLLPVTIPEKKLANTIRLETIIIIFSNLFI